MEGELAHIGAGLAAIGSGAAAIGVGNVAGNFLSGALRNPRPQPARQRPCSSVSHSQKHWASSRSWSPCC